MLETFVLVGLDWAKPMMNFSLHVTCSCIVHAYVPFHSLFWYFLWLVLYVCFSLSLPLSRTVYAWHLSANPLHLETLYIMRHLFLILLLFLSSFVIRRPVRTSQRTSLDVEFIRNAAWFYRSFPILLYPLSFTIGDGNLYMRFPWDIPPWSYRISTPICTVSIPLYLGLLHRFKVYIS